MGWISADKGWITQELTPQYSQPAVILLAYKKLRCGRAFVCLDMVSRHTNITSFLEVGANAGRERGETGREVEQGGGKIVREDIVTLLQHEM